MEKKPSYVAIFIPHSVQITPVMDLPRTVLGHGHPCSICLHKEVNVS